MWPHFKNNQPTANFPGKREKPGHSPEISIITAVYQSAAFLRQTAETVFAQTFDDWEWILWDDGSSDGSYELIRDIAARAPERIRVYQHPEGANRGPAASRNLAARKARGDILAFLDADDLWQQQALDHMSGLLADHSEVAMVWTPAEYFGDHIESFCQPTGLSGSAVVFQAPTLVGHYMDHLRGTPCIGGLLVRREAFMCFGGFEEHLRRGEDISLWFKIAMARPVLFDDRMILGYRRHEDSSTSRARREGQMRIWDAAFQKWLLEKIQSHAHLRPFQSKAERMYHGVLHLTGSNWFSSRLRVWLGLRQVPGLFTKRFIPFFLSLWMPFSLAKRLTRRLHIWMTLC